MLQLNSDKVRKQLEIENLEHTLKIEKDSLEQKRKVDFAHTHTYVHMYIHMHTHTHAHIQTFEDAMKTEQAEKHALEKQLMVLQQRLQEESEAEREYALVKKQ